jgi:hypothetical protein
MHDGALAGGQKNNALLSQRTTNEQQTDKKTNKRARAHVVGASPITSAKRRKHNRKINTDTRADKWTREGRVVALTWDVTPVQEHEKSDDDKDDNDNNDAPMKG